MGETFRLIEPQFVPPLDPGFRPASLANRAFRHEVIASGEGVPLIFDRFYQAESSRANTEKDAGTGLGLSICKWIAEAHSGTIKVDSQQGHGTTFTVAIPKLEYTAVTRSHIAITNELRDLYRATTNIGSGSGHHHHEEQQHETRDEHSRESV